MLASSHPCSWDCSAHESRGRSKYRWARFQHALSHRTGLRCMFALVGPRLCAVCRTLSCVGCLGINNCGQCSIPPSSNAFVSVSTAGTSTCGITTTGKLLCYGCKCPTYNGGQVRAGFSVVFLFTLRCSAMFLALQAHFCKFRRGRLCSSLFSAPSLL